MAFYCVFAIRTDPFGHPLDVRDLDACLQLVDFIPEIKDALPSMASLSPGWAAVVREWDRLAESHLDEVGLGWSKSLEGPRTAHMLRGVVKGFPFA